MRLDELLAKYPAPSLQASNGDAKFRRSVWAPFFENLYENKVIYRERFVCMARIENLEITDIGVGGLIVPLTYLYVPEYIRGAPKKAWGFGGGWAHMTQGDGNLGCKYSGWTIWPEAERVRTIEALLSKGDVEGALEYHRHGQGRPRPEA